MDTKTARLEDDEKSLISHHDRDYNREKRSTSFFIQVEKWKSNYSIQFHFTTHLTMSKPFLLICQAFVFFILCALSFYWNTSSYMLQWQYDEQCKSQIKQVCHMKILVSKKVPKDSVLFLKLHGFRQNDRM